MVGPAATGPVGTPGIPPGLRDRSVGDASSACTLLESLKGAGMGQAGHRALSSFDPLQNGATGVWVYWLGFRVFFLVAATTPLQNIGV